jgi:predicted amidohydrolase
MERLCLRVDEASHFQPDLICLPECTLTGYLYKRSDVSDFSEPANGQTMQQMAELARCFQVSLCYGFLESTREGVYNSVALLNKKGELLHIHRKVNEKAPFLCGHSFTLINTEFGDLGIMICGDLFLESVETFPDTVQLVLMPMSRCFDGLSPDPKRWEHQERKVYLEAVQAIGIPTAIVNTLTEGTKEVAFGGALMVDGNGRLLAESPHGSDELLIWEMMS